MKKISFGVLLCLMTAVFSGNVPYSVMAAGEGGDFRAVWVSSVYNMDFPSARGLSVAEMKKEADSILDRAADLGLNAIILQVRPHADALYKSEIFPWSAVLTGEQGVAPAGGFDPLAYWIEKAHAKGLELHAWINPYRISTASQKITKVSQLATSHPARKNPNMAVLYQDALYFDPGLPESKKLIVDSVTEILKNYDVDGIHLDDYFYPGIDFPDSKSYAQHGSGKSKDDWRRENVNDVIKAIQQCVRLIKPNVRFGISPTAIWQNASSTPLGSDTKGYESYKSAYADTRRWVKEGWLDYICPQIYWYIGYQIADYQKVLSWWANVCDGTGVDLYVGHAAYREDEKTDNWQGEILRQLRLNALTPQVKGSVFFRFLSLKGDLGGQIKQYYQTLPISSPKPTATPALISPAPTSRPIMPLPTTTPTPVTTPTPAPTPVTAPAYKMSQLTVAQPSANTSVTEGTGYTILGTCDPNKDLFINGELITSRTPEGFFSVYVPLVKGQNAFTFTQAGQTAITRTITLKDAAIVPAETMKTPAVSKAFPTAAEYASTGYTITLRCTAPAGSKVTARFNQQTISLKQDNSNLTSGTTIYAATFSATYTVSASGTGIVNLGKPTYTAEYKGSNYSATASASVFLINNNTPYYATVTAESAWIYPNATTNGGSSWQAVKGQKDRVMAITSNGNWVKLACGGWIEKDKVACASSPQFTLNVLSVGSFRQNGATDVFYWPATAYPVTSASFDGKKLTLFFGMQQDFPGLNAYPTNTIYEIVGGGMENGTAYCVFSFKDDANIEGFYVDYADNELRLNIKRRKTLSTGSLPLTGFTFVIDAGHGGTQTGALGPMGKTIAEKDINLSNALKLSRYLTQLGATVVNVRSTDADFSLDERNEISRKINPDMFISIHANSMVETTDSSNVRGLTVWYRNPNSLPLAQALTTDLFSVNPLTTRRPNTNQSNFYVCRPAWAPSVIIETSFICNIQDFAWLINDQCQDQLALAITNSILAYYRG